MPNMPCDQCETVRHCGRFGCIPVQPLAEMPRLRLELRLEELMRRCREDGHQLQYQDLVELRGKQ